MSSSPGRLQSEEASCLLGVLGPVCEDVLASIKPPNPLLVAEGDWLLLSRLPTDVFAAPPH